MRTAFGERVLLGLGTFDEVMEVLTLRQLGIHSKPVALVNTRGYFDRFAELIRHAIAEGFVHEEMWSDIAVVDTPEVRRDYRYRFIKV